MLMLLVTLAVQDPTLVARVATDGRYELHHSVTTTLESDSLDFVLGAAIIGNDVLVAGFRTNVMRFDRRTGRLLSTVTRRGSGPGEVRSPLFLHSLGDSLFLYDQALLRASVFGPGRYDFIRQVAVRARGPATVVPWAGRILVAAATARAEAVGFPLHEYAWDGTLVRSFGSRDELLSWRRRGTADRLASPTGNGDVWTVSVRGPTVVERFRPNGVRRVRVEYAAGAEPDSVPQGPTIWRSGIQDLVPGIAAVVTVIPDRHWQRGVLRRPADDVHGATGIAIGSRPLLWDSLIDAVDVTSGAIVARLRLDGWVSHLLPGGFLIVHREATNGEPLITVEQLTIHPQPR